MFKIKFPIMFKLGKEVQAEIWRSIFNRRGSHRKPLKFYKTAKIKSYKIECKTMTEGKASKFTNLSTKL